MGALFLSEAGRIAGHGYGELFFGDNLVDKLAYHGVLACSDEVQILALYLVHHGIHLGKAHYAGYDV